MSVRGTGGITGPEHRGGVPTRGAERERSPESVSVRHDSEIPDDGRWTAPSAWAGDAADHFLICRERGSSFSERSHAPCPCHQAEQLTKNSAI